MTLRLKDIELLESARDDHNGDLNRNQLIDAFKRAGATIVRGNINEIRIQFMDGAIPYDLPLGQGPVDLTARHKNFRNILSELARDLLVHCKVG